LPEPTHHVWLRGDVAGWTGFGELAGDQPATARGEGAINLCRESARRRVRAPFGEYRLVEPGRPIVGGLAFDLDR
jgi:hypothetical protein